MKKIIKNLDKPLLLISIVLFIIGTIMIFSASNVTAYMKYYASPYQYFYRQVIIIVVSVFAAFFFIRFKTKSYSIIMTLAIYVVAALLVFVLLYGSVKNRSIRWINLGLLNIQPAEFAKIVVIFWMASYYDSHKKGLDKYVTTLYPLLIAMAMAGLIMAEPDLDTTVIYVLIVGTVFLLSPISKEVRNKIIMFGLGLGAIILVTLMGTGGSILTPGQQERLTSFHNPCSNEKYYTTGNQVCNGYIAINHGGLTGVGLGNSTQKYLYLPEAHTDFIFAITMEELGLIGAGFIFILYFLVVGRIIKIAKESYTTRGFLICIGVAAYIVLHIGVNLGGMFGLMPTTGVPLPFMSYGGSFTICLIMALTAVQRVNIENKIYKEKNSK